MEKLKIKSLTITSEVITAKISPIVSIKTAGYIDTSNYKEFQKTLFSFVKDSYQNFLFDLEKLNYVSSAGIGAFVAVSKSTENLVKIREFVKGCCLGATNLTDIEIDSMFFAVDEAYLNIMIHSYKNDPSKFIHITFKIDNYQLRIVLEDSGKEFDPLRNDMPDLDKHKKNIKPMDMDWEHTL